MPRRELINTGSDKRFARRNKKGQFKESDDVGRSLAADRRRKAKTDIIQLQLKVLVNEAEGLGFSGASGLGGSPYTELMDRGYWAPRTTPFGATQSRPAVAEPKR